MRNLIERLDWQLHECIADTPRGSAADWALWVLHGALHAIGLPWVIAEAVQDRRAQRRTR